MQCWTGWSTSWNQVCQEKYQQPQICRTLESPLDWKEMEPVNPKGNQPWMFIGRNDVEAETPIFWPLAVKSRLIGKDPDVGKDWRQEEKGATENEMVTWYHQLNGHAFGWTPWVGDGQGGLACCSPWGCKESDTTEWLNWTELILIYAYYQKRPRRVFQVRKPCLDYRRAIMDSTWFMEPM